MSIAGTFERERRTQRKLGSTARGLDYSEFSACCPAGELFRSRRSNERTRPPAEERRRD